MRKVTVFGKPGGGKSTLAKNLSQIHSIEYFPLDLIEYQPDGERITRNEFLAAHKRILSNERWIIEGLGVLQAFWERIDAADTIIYIDLPYRIHYWWVIKRFILSAIKQPEGWPKGSSVLKGTINGFKYLRLSRKFWTPDLLQQIKARSAGKTFLHVTNVKDLNTLSKK